MLSFEHYRKPLLPIREFYKRLFSNSMFAIGIIIVSLIIGLAGYMGLAHLNFADALLNSSMILSGMGPVDPMPDNASKYFASFYALFSGVVFLSTITVLFAPIVHRVMHKFRLETDTDEEKSEPGAGDKN